MHGIPAAGISGIPIIAFTMLSIVTGDDVRTLPWDTLMLVAGGLSLGLAIQETHLDLYFLEQLKNIHVAPIMLVVIFAFCTVIFSNIMSNTATATILIPVAVLWEIVDPIFLPLVIGLSASCALLLPISTPPNAIAYATGLLDQKEFRLGGLVAGLIGPIIVIAWLFLLLKIF
jgi:sodium-dependent dicarboxylate transporter 2/3/5